MWNVLYTRVSTDDKLQRHCARKIPDSEEILHYSGLDAAYWENRQVNTANIQVLGYHFCYVAIASLGPFRPQKSILRFLPSSSARFVSLSRVVCKRDTLLYESARHFQKATSRDALRLPSSHSRSYNSKCAAETQPCAMLKQPEFLPIELHLSHSAP